jgi:hypothetical protein
LGSDVLQPYKGVIERWLWPDVLKNQNWSVAKAKKAITDYKRAVNRPEGLAELTVFFCEKAMGFCREISLYDDGYYRALARMFGQALATVLALPPTQRGRFLERLQEVRSSSRSFGGGIDEAIDEIWLEADLK